MRPLVWWVQDHLGLAVVGLLGIAAVVVAIVIAASGGSSEAPAPTSKVATDASRVAAPSPGRSQDSGDQATEAPAATNPGSRSGARTGAAHNHRAARHRATEPTRAGGVESSSTDGGRSSRQPKGTGAADSAAADHPKPPQPTKTAQHSLSQATAEKVAAAHPGTSCPKSYSRKQCEEAVQAAAVPAAPSTAATQPSDCAKAMSEAQCEELFAAEAAARAAGTGSISVQECMEHPEQEKCAAVVEEMKAQYEAAHPGG
jgi:hypothetical protein